jgi:predicted nucleic acid-binding protein
MNAYLDTGVLIPLYVSEAFSEAITTYMENRAEAVPLSAFHRLELENALHLKVFRGEITDDLRGAALRKIETHLETGMLSLRPVNWTVVLDRARHISKRVTSKSGCRTLDVIHVAIAAQWGCSVFVTADDRQLAAARCEGLGAVDLRLLRREGREEGTPPDMVKERHAPYRARRRAARR